MTGRAGAGTATGDATQRARRRPTRPSRLVRPVRPLVPLASCAGVVLAWELVAHNSGAGWVQALGDVLAAVLLIGLVAPAVVIARADVALHDTTADATAGLPVDLPGTATTRLRARPLDPPGPTTFVGPHAEAGDTARRWAVAGSGRIRPARGAARPAALGGDAARRTAGAGTERVTLLPECRGVYRHLVVEIATAAPFGLLWWRKVVVVDLPRELCVGPRLGQPLPLPRRPEDTAGDGARRAPVQVGEPRGVRPYRPGDNRRWVHWPSTAHSGGLMVREMEGPVGEPVTVEVRLPSDAEAAERAAERALGTVVALVDRGIPVVMATTEDGGPRVGVVADRHAAGRRLARAVAEPDPRGVPAAPAGHGRHR